MIETKVQIKHKTASESKSFLNEVNDIEAYIIQ